MKLKIITPTEVVADIKVKKINAESVDGFFTLLPKHADFVANLDCSILTYVEEGNGKEKTMYAGIDLGVLTKVDREVNISTRRAIVGTDLKTLQKNIEEEFKKLDDNEKKARTASTMMEGDLAKLFLDLKE